MVLVESQQNVKIEITTHPSADGKTEVTTYKIRNPLAARHWPQILRDLEGHCKKEIDAWRDAKMKAILPEWCYKYVHSGKVGLAQKAFDYMEQSRIELVHPDGQSLERQIWVQGKPVAIFQIELSEQ